MRLGLVVPGGLHRSGRIEVVPLWLSLLERLARRHEVHAFELNHLDRPESFTLHGAHVHELGAPGRRAIVGKAAQYRALRAAVAEHGPFHLLHGFFADPSGLVTAALGRRLGVPTVVTFDSGELVSIPTIGYGSQRSWRGRAVVALAARWASCVHVCSRSMERLARAHGLHVKRVPIGLDLAATPAMPMAPPGPPWRLLQIASLNRVKDHRTLLEAVARIPREIPVELDLVGEDTLGGDLVAHARRLGIIDRVTFHGFVPHADLPPLRARAHLYVQSSRHEGSGAAVLEAAAAGLPLVGTRVGYLADWSPDGATAVDPGDAAGLAEAIVELLRDPDRRRLQASVARPFAHAHDVDWTVAALEQLYDEVIERQRS